MKLLILAQGKAPAGKKRFIYSSLYLEGLHLSLTEQPQVQTATCFSSHQPIRTHGEKKGRGGLFLQKDLPSVLHMRAQDVNVASLIFFCAGKNYCVAQKLWRVKINVFIVNYTGHMFL